MQHTKKERKRKRVTDNNQLGRGGQVDREAVKRWRRQTSVFSKELRVDSIDCQSLSYCCHAVDTAVMLVHTATMLVHTAAIMLYILLLLFSRPKFRLFCVGLSHF